MLVVQSPAHVECSHSRDTDRRVSARVESIDCAAICWFYMEHRPAPAGSFYRRLAYVQAALYLC